MVDPNVHKKASCLTSTRGKYSIGSPRSQNFIIECISVTNILVNTVPILPLIMKKWPCNIFGYHKSGMLLGESSKRANMKIFLGYLLSKLWPVVFACRIEGTNIRNINGRHPSHYMFRHRQMHVKPDYIFFIASAFSSPSWSKKYVKHLSFSPPPTFDPRNCDIFLVRTVTLLPALCECMGFWIHMLCRCQVQYP